MYRVLRSAISSAVNGTSLLGLPGPLDDAFLGGFGEVLRTGGFAGLLIHPEVLVVFLAVLFAFHKMIYIYIYILYRDQFA